MKNENLYFLAIVPPAFICEEIISIQKDITERFQSSAAIKVIPHITLKAPFRLPAEEHKNVIRWFNQMIINVAPFNLELKDFDTFKNPKQPVIYIKPVFSPALFDLQKQISDKFNTTFPDIPFKDTELEFKPHLTVAYRDLKPRFFEEVWQEFQTKNYEASFSVTGFWLMQHNGQRWESIFSHDLK